jgi:hypothetical protein
MTVHHLRARVLAQSPPPPTTLARAVGTLGFVQADPIRFPARAQDLILRHRMADYSVGDLERAFPRLRLEEDFLYAYGFMPRRIARLLHPPRPESADGCFVPTGLAAELLALIREQGPIHRARSLRGSAVAEVNADAPLLSHRCGSSPTALDLACHAASLACSAASSCAVAVGRARSPCNSAG